MYCLNLKTGKVDWAAPLDKSGGADAPTVKDSFIYYCGDWGDIYKFDKLGNRLWKASYPNLHIGHAISPYNNNLFVGTVSNGVFEYDVNSGKIISHYGKNTLGVTLPVFANNSIFIGGLVADSSNRAKGDYLFSLDERTRQLKWKKKTGEYVDRLFINNQKIYYLDYGISLNCLDLLTGNTLWKSDSLYHHIGRLTSGNPHLIFKDNIILYYDTDLRSILKLSNPNGKLLGQSSYDAMVRANIVKPNKIQYSLQVDNEQYRETVSDSLIV